MIKTPVLDNKSYREILNEALASIPAMTNKWTDFNPQDAGIMLLELCAALTEIQNYYLDQVDERYYRHFLKLLTNAEETKSIEELTRLLAQMNNQLRRAVTVSDYRHILLRQHMEFGIDKVQVKKDGKVVWLYIYRDSGPLSEQEISDLGACLERYRLLTVRIRIKQVERRPIRIDCRVELDEKRLHTEKTSKMIREYLKQAVTGKDMAAPLNTQAIRSKLLSMPEVSRIHTLSFQEQASGESCGLDRPYVFLYPEEIHIEVF